MTPLATKKKALGFLIKLSIICSPALFVGFCLASKTQHSIDKECSAGILVMKNMLLFQIISFSLFFFSAMVAMGVQHLLDAMEADESFRPLNPRALNYLMRASAIGTFMAFVCMMISIVEIVQIRKGVFSCSMYAVFYVVVLVIPVSLSLLFFIWAAMLVFT